MMKEQLMNEDIITNKVILRSVYKNAKYTIEPCKDPRTNRFPSCVRPVNANGDIILTEKERTDEHEGNAHYVPENAKFLITDGKTFDLNDTIERAEWEAIKFSSLIAESRTAKDKNGNLKIDGDTRNNTATARYGRAELYIDRPGQTAQTKVTKKIQQYKAIDYILKEERGLDGLILKAKLLGRNMKGQPSAEIQAYLIEIAERTPERIIDLYEDSNLSYRLLFIDAKDKHIIYFKDRTYQFEENILAATDEAVITWMKQDKNRALVELIKKETYPELYIEETKPAKKSTKAEKAE